MHRVRDSILCEYEHMTAVEQSVADFFLKNEELRDFSSRNVAGMLYISEATLSRFAQKCGYKGYRNFIYDYKRELEEELQDRNIGELTKRVRNTYTRLLEREFQQLDEEKIKNVAEMLCRHSRVLVCGLGSSGFVAREFYLRFMRLGLDVQALTDTQVISMSVAMCQKGMMVIGLSLSGKTQVILDAMQVAKEKGAATAFITADRETRMVGICDEVLFVASDLNLEGGTAISPQFPILMLMDVLYTYYLKNDTKEKRKRWQDTMAALRRSGEHESIR